MRSFVSHSLFAGTLSLGMVLLSPIGLRADDEPDSASDSKPAAAKVSNTKVTGVMEAIVSKPISADTDQIESLVIERIVDHGTSVTNGQNVVWFETKEIDKKIKEAEIVSRLAKLTMEDDEFNHKQFHETQKLDRSAAERTRKSAQQAFDNFAKVDRERSIKTAAHNLKSSHDSLANAMEELKQLQQMYEEDDLTEESEEIVLTRAKRAVESAKFRLEGAKITAQRTLKQSIPRSVAQQDSTLARADLAYKKAVRDLNSAATRQRIEMQRKRDAFRETEEKLAELKQERKRLVLTSPIDGIVLHGKLTRGKISDKPSTLEAGSKVTATQVLATVVSPKKLHIRVDLAEKLLSVVKPGTKCIVRVQALPGFETTGTVKSVSQVPYAGTKYDCVVTFKQNRDSDIRPTMTCELEFADASDGDKKEANGKKAKGKKGKGSKS